MWIRADKRKVLWNSIMLTQPLWFTQVWKALKHVGEAIILPIQLPLLIILLARIFDVS